MVFKIGQICFARLQIPTQPWLHRIPGIVIWQDAEMLLQSPEEAFQWNLSAYLQQIANKTIQTEYFCIILTLHW